MPNRPCPRCTFPLVAQQKTTPVGSCVIDVCPRCQGAFFEAGEAKAVLGENAEPSAWERTNAARFIAQRRHMQCPLGHGALSAFALQAPPRSGTEVEVDVCPVCMGMWLDAWEAARVVQATRALRAPSPDLSAAEQADAGIPQKTGAGWYLFQLFTALPVEEYNPVRRKPLVCILLMIACTLIFLAEMAAPSPEAFIQFYGLVPQDLLHGRHVWSVVTHMFLHGGIAHIVFNMYFLYIFGDNVEDRVGRVRFLVIYLAFGLFAAATQVAFTLGSDAPLVGASGAIAGLMGAYLVLFPKVRVYQVLFFVRFKIPMWVYLIIWMGLQTLSGFISIQQHQTTGVAFWAHVGGFAAGAMWGALNRGKYAVTSS